MRSLASFRIKHVFIGGLVLSFHYALTVYINSTLLNQFFTEKEVGYLYTYGALLTLCGFILSSSIIKRIGNARFMLVALCIEIVALLSLFKVSNPDIIKIFFIIHQALPALLAFSLDLFLEGASRNHHNTGRVRSTYLTILNTAFVFSPIITGKIVLYFSYQGVYLVSALFCIILLFILIDSLRHIPSHSLKEVNFIDSVRKYTPHKDLDRIYILQFLLQIFYAVMVIYTPLYLTQSLGFSWQSIGFIFTAMLLPFILFQAPLGRFFDSAHTEKDTLIAGFIIMAASTSLIFFVNSSSILVWMVILFTTRVGASFVEVALDYSFFRRITDRDAGFMSVFRTTGPTSYIIAPLLVAPVVHFLFLQYIFLFVGIIMLIGIIFSYKLRTLR